MQGQKFNRVTVLAVVGRGPAGHVLVQYQCECGAVKTARASDVQRGKVQSCGCARVDANKNMPHAKGKHWRWLNRRRQPC